MGESNELEREVGTLHLAKIGVIVKGAKMRLIHDLRRNGTNARVTFQERLVLPRLKNLKAGIMDLFQAKHQREGVGLPRRFQAVACGPNRAAFPGWNRNGWFLLVSYSLVRSGIRTSGLV